jgi:hypothetical protein
MLGRSRRLIPVHHFRLIQRQRLPRPNWFVGAAEQPSIPRDPALVADIDRVKSALRKQVKAQVAQEHQPLPVPAEGQTTAGRRTHGTRS